MQILPRFFHFSFCRTLHIESCFDFVVRALQTTCLHLVAEPSRGLKANHCLWAASIGSNSLSQGSAHCYDDYPSHFSLLAESKPCLQTSLSKNSCRGAAYSPTITAFFDCIQVSVACSFPFPSDYSARTGTPTSPIWRFRLQPTPRTSQNPRQLHTFFVCNHKPASVHKKKLSFYAINFDFCKQSVQSPRSSASKLSDALSASKPQTRACTKLLVRSGLRCHCCFRVKSACLCPKQLFSNSGVDSSPLR